MGRLFHMGVKLPGPWATTFFFSKGKCWVLSYLLKILYGTIHLSKFSRPRGRLGGTSTLEMRWSGRYHMNRRKLLLWWHGNIVSWPHILRDHLGRKRDRSKIWKTGHWPKEIQSSKMFCWNQPWKGGEIWKQWIFCFEWKKKYHPLVSLQCPHFLECVCV